MKAYPLRIERIAGYDEPPAYFSKGHQCPAAFLAEVRRQYEPVASLSDPRHLWWRCIPEGPDAEMPYTVQRAAPGRGAFPVTYCEVLPYGVVG